MAKTSAKKFIEGQVVSFNWRGARQGVVVGSKGSLAFVFADFGEGLGVCCKRVFMNTLFAGTQEPGKALLTALDKWAVDHQKVIKPFVADITTESTQPKTKTQSKPKVESKVSKTQPKGLDIQALAKGLASGGLTPVQIAQVINLVR